MRRFGDRRQVNLERGTESRLTVGPDVAAALLYDTVNHGQSQPTPLADSLGREERLEEVLHRLPIHPLAGVADHQGYIRAGGYGYAGTISHVLVGKSYVAGFQCKGTAFRHCVARIDRK